MNLCPLQQAGSFFDQVPAHPEYISAQFVCIIMRHESHTHETADKLEVGMPPTPTQYRIAQCTETCLMRLRSA